MWQGRDRGRQETTGSLEGAGECGRGLHPHLLGTQPRPDNSQDCHGQGVGEVCFLLLTVCLPAPGGRWKKMHLPIASKC